MKIFSSNARGCLCALFVLLLLPAAAFPLPDTPEQRAGERSRVIPSVSIGRGGQSIAADTKAPVYWQDVVNTLATGRARVSLDDGSVGNFRAASHCVRG